MLIVVVSRDLFVTRMRAQDVIGPVTCIPAAVCVLVPKIRNLNQNLLRWPIRAKMIRVVMSALLPSRVYMVEKNMIAILSMMGVQGEGLNRDTVQEAVPSNVV